MNTLIVVAVLGIISMLSDILGYRKILFPIVLAGLLLALGVTVSEWNSQTVYFDMLLIDNYSVAFSSLILGLLFIWILLSQDQYKLEFNMADQFALIFFSSVGALVLVSFSSLVMLFIGIEVMSIPLYILAGSRKSDLRSNEASLKYFMMGAFTTGILLFGIALIYGATGSFDIAIIKEYVSQNATSGISGLLYTGVIFMIIALCFKVSAVPFHFWSPDVYQGAPMMITTFMASIVKTAAFGAFYRLFGYALADIGHHWAPILSIVIIATILAGNIMAVNQTNVKRMLAYSGISQAGYMLMTLLVLNDNSANALLFYAGSYALATMTAFFILYMVSEGKEDEGVEVFNGLSKKQPLLAVIMTVSMLSLAGIPPAVGFFAKFYLFTAVLNAGHTSLVIIAVIGSIISVYYYFKIIIAIYGKESSSEVSPSQASFKLSAIYQTILIVLVTLIVLFGINPNILIGVI